MGLWLHLSGTMSHGFNYFPIIFQKNDTKLKSKHAAINQECVWTEVPGSMVQWEHI